MEESTFESGNALFICENYEGAVEEYTTYIKQDDKDKKHFDAMLHRGIAYLRLGKIQSALDDFTTLLKVQPDDFQTNFRAAQALFHQEDFVGCRTSLEKAKSFTDDDFE